MERIGIAASKIAKGNLFLYNLFVVLLSFLFSLLIFILAGASLVLSLVVIGYIVSGLLPQNFEKEWTMVMRVCMISLTVMISLFNLMAILKNVKISKPR